MAKRIMKKFTDTHVEKVWKSKDWCGDAVPVEWKIERYAEKNNLTIVSMCYGLIVPPRGYDLGSSEVLVLFEENE